MSLGAKIWNLLAYGTLGAVDDSDIVQMGQVSVGGMEVQNPPMVGLFGLASNPPAGAQVALIYPGGDRVRGIAIGVNHGPSRPTGQASGETTLYNNFGMSIRLTAGGVVINGGGKPVQFVNVGESITMAATLAVTGAITVDGVTVTVP